MKEKASLLSATFLEMVKIPSPSGDEKMMASNLTKKMKRLGWKQKVNKTRRKNESNADNVIFSQNSGKSKTLMFVAHMDTVQKKHDLIKPIFQRGVFTSDGHTILGADNKAGVSILLSIASEIYDKKLIPQVNIIYAFTTREESGRMGSEFLPIANLSPDYIFNVDGTGEVGTVDHASLGYIAFELTIKGKAAHSAMNPEKGVHALTVLNTILGKTQFGKRNDGSLFNIGIIRGGNNANVIMPEVYVKGEFRAFDKVILQRNLNEFKAKIISVCQKEKAQFELQIHEQIPPFHGREESNILKYLKEAIESKKIRYKSRRAFYTSDASYLSQWKIPTATLCKGGQGAHTTDESITLKELEKMKEIVAYLITHSPAY